MATYEGTAILPGMTKEEAAQAVRNKAAKIKRAAELPDLGWLKTHKAKIQTIIDLLPEGDPFREWLFDRVRAYMKLLRLLKRAQDIEDGVLPFNVHLSYPRDSHYPIAGGAPATYYIDNDNGNDGNGGQAIGDAWATIAKYTTTEIRTAGDLAYMRANQTWTIGASIAPDEDGTANAYIELRGASSADDPWSDGSDVKPIVDFNSGNFQFNMVLDDYWKLKNIDFKDSVNAGSAVSVVLSGGIKIEDCVMRDNKMGIQVNTPGGCSIKDTTVDNSTDENIKMSGDGKITIEGCVIDSGAATSTYGLRIQSGGQADIKETTFGATTPHATADIYIVDGGLVRMRNVLLASTEIDPATPGIYWFNGATKVHMGEYDQTGLAQKSIYFTGTVTRDSGTTRTGGASSSAKVEPNANCGSEQEITLAEDFLGGDFAIYCSAASTTVSVWIRAITAWASYPTASQLYIDAEYYDQAGADYSRAFSTASTQTISDGSTWVEFTTTFTPTHVGWAYVRVHLNYYEATEGIYVDVKPVVS